MDDTGFDAFVLAQMPHFMAINYQRLLAAPTSEERVLLILHTYNLGLRALTLNLVSQYLIRDRDRVNDPYLNDLLSRKFPHLTLDAWPQLLFATLRAYEGQRQLLFMPELYDFYWDTTTLRHRHRQGVERPFERLTQIATEVLTPRRPHDQTNWGRLAEETLGLLRQILRGFSFIDQYDLIRVLDHDEHAYDFELHKGTTVVRERQPLPVYIEFNRGWFYLRAKSEDFLRLYPLLVFWEPEPAGSEIVRADTGVYDRFIYERLRYLLATPGKPVEDEKGVAAFITLLFDTIEEVKRKRREAEKLTWWQLREICAEITQQRIETVRRKYRGELYLQRDTTRQAFERFLESDKRCFVLIGKSGVGKSNFFLSLGEHLRQARSDDICVLMYDGAQINMAQSVTEVINRDFDNRLFLAGRRVEQIWREIAQIDGIDERRVVLFVDAINENPRATDLLRQLDELVQGWPWLKVVFSSRPETWKSIKRGVKLTEGLYYREEGAETVGVELEPFSYSERMDPFTRQELPAVYAKYQQVFELQTAFAVLPHPLREMLRDPLSLWLIAKTYEKAAIPDRLKTTELIERYVDAMKRSERLSEEDLRLLEKQLVPLMVRAGHYSNEITIGDIDTAGADLYEHLYNEQVLGDGRRMNQSFTSLVDAEILVRQEEGREQKIVFKYERFYEYFIGKALFEQVKLQTAWDGEYREWISQVPKSPYLWGAIKVCLVQQLQVLQPATAAALCTQLARIPDQRMVEVLIAALTEYGGDEPDRAGDIIENLLDQGRGRIGSVLRREIATVQCPAWKRVGITVASNLALERLITFALTDPSPAVRAVAIRHAFIYWRREREGGFAVLQDLMGRAIGFWGLPKTSVFESFVGLSLLILFYDFREAETVARLRTIWRRAIEQLLRINPHNLGGRREQVKGWVRTLLLQAIARFVVRTASEVPSNSMLSIRELKQFFIHDGALERRHAIIRKLTRFLDVKATNVRDIRADLLVLIAERDMFIALLTIIVLQRHSIAHPETTLSLLKEIFDQAIDIDPPGPFSIVSIAANINEATYEAYDEMFSSLRHYMYKTCLDRFQGKWSSNFQERRFSYLKEIGFLEVGHFKDVAITPLAKSYVERMMQDKDYIWMRDVIQWDLTIQAIEAGYPRFTLSTLDILVNANNSNVQQSIVELLARMRVYYPDEIDDFMSENHMDEKRMMDVRTHRTSETIGDLLNLRAYIFLNEAIVLGGSPDFWRRWTWVLGRLPECRSLESWLTILFKFVVNEIYGGSVFMDIPA